MESLEKLRGLKIGNTIAELDEELNSNYISSTTFFDFIDDRYDLIRGAKGTGKTALLLYVCANKNQFIALSDVLIIKANEHSGDPSFKKAFRNLHKEDGVDVYSDAWRIYIINLIWEAVEQNCNSTAELKKYLEKKKLLTKDTGFLSRIVYAILRAKASITANDVEYSIEMGKLPESENFVDFNYVFESLASILRTNNKRVWILLDRLDDAFPDWSDESRLAIKALLFVYKDLLGIRLIKLKTFLRIDIFDNVTKDSGFTSLSHIIAKASPPIAWDENQMKDFIIKRIGSICEPEHHTVDERIKYLFGEQIDVGKRKPDSFHWVINHLKDGNGQYTPRDVIDFIENARKYTIVEIESSGKASETALFSKSALKTAWRIVSINKLQSQLLAENPELKDVIDLFRDKKAEYSPDAMMGLFGASYKEVCAKLCYIGFLGTYGENWKIPYLYRPCINVKQGVL